MKAAVIVDRVRTRADRHSRCSGDQAAVWLEQRERARLPAEPGCIAREPGPDRPEGRGLCRARARIRDRDAHQSRRQRIPQRGLGEYPRRDGNPGVLPDEHVRLPTRRQPLRAGHGVLLDHRGAEVHPEPGLRHHAATREHGVAGHPHQPARHRQLVLVGQARRRALRKGRRGRRRGRRGDPPRVRPRDPGLAAVAPRLRLLARGRRDRRRLRATTGP